MSSQLHGMVRLGFKIGPLNSSSRGLTTKKKESRKKGL